MIIYLIEKKNLKKKELINFEERPIGVRLRFRVRRKTFSLPPITIKSSIFTQ